MPTLRTIFQLSLNIYIQNVLDAPIAFVKSALPDVLLGTYLFFLVRKMSTPICFAGGVKLFIQTCNECIIYCSLTVQRFICLTRSSNLNNHEVFLD